MKTLVLLPCCLLLIANAHALAMDAKYCESQGTGLIGAEHAAFIKSCLAKIGSPAYVEELTRQNKKLSCEKNAKNKALRDNEKAGYIATCMERNEAAEALAAPHTTSPGTDTASAANDNTATLPKMPAANAANDNTTTPQKEPASNVTNNNTAIPPETSTTQNEVINRSCNQDAQQKGLRGNTRKQFITTCEEEMDLARYKLAGDEIKKHKRNDALWYKAFAEANGEERAAEATYIRMRVNQLRRCCVPIKR